jgi:hypothetical protein
MLFIVMQEPKAKHRAGMVVKVQVVEAKTKRAALEMSARNFENMSEFKKPLVQPLVLDHCYRL